MQGIFPGVIEAIRMSQNPNQGIYDAVMNRPVTGIAGPTPYSLPVQGPNAGIQSYPGGMGQGGGLMPQQKTPEQFGYEEEAKKIDEKIAKLQQQKEEKMRVAATYKPPQMDPTMGVRPGAAGLALGLGLLLNAVSKGKGWGTQGVQGFWGGAQQAEGVRQQNRMNEYKAGRENAMLEADILGDQINQLERRYQRTLIDADKQAGRDLQRQGIIERAFTTVRNPEDVDAIEANLAAQGVEITPAVRSALDKARAASQKRVDGEFTLKKQKAIAGLAKDMGVSASKLEAMDGKVTPEEAERINSTSEYWESVYELPAGTLPRISPQTTLGGQKQEESERMGASTRTYRTEMARIAGENAETNRKRAEDNLKNIDSLIGWRNSKLGQEANSLSMKQKQEIGLNLRNDMTTLTQQANSIRVSIRQLQKGLIEKTLTPEGAQLAAQDIRNLTNQLGIVQKAYAEAAARKRAIDSNVTAAQKTGGVAVGTVKEFPQYPGVKYRWDGSEWVKVK